MANSVDKKARRSQQQRREETQAQVLGAARQLFGKQGYADTSLDQIAAACGISVRPVYHYFGSKKALFAAVNEEIESEWTTFIQEREGSWSLFLERLLDAQSCRIVLIDAPTILGRDRWLESPVTQAALTQLMRRLASQGASEASQQIAARMLAAVLAEAAQYIAQADDPAIARAHCEPLIERFFAAL